MNIQTKAVTQLINKLREQILHDQGVSLADMDALQASVDTLVPATAGSAPVDPETVSYDWMAAEKLKGRVISDGMREAYEEALRSVGSSSGPHGQRAAEGDAIGRSKSILRLVDEYAERPSADTRTTLRQALMMQFERNVTPHDLLEIARATGLRGYLHGVSPSVARELLTAFVAAVPAAACGGLAAE